MIREIIKWAWGWSREGSWGGGGVGWGGGVMHQVVLNYGIKLNLR